MSGSEMPRVSGSGQAPPTTIGFGEALGFWLKLGFIGFGGPAGQISLMHQELVERRHWISNRRFLHAMNFCLVLPGPEAQQLATYLGWLMHRTRGGLVAGVLFLLPSLLLLIALSYVAVAHGHQPWVAGIFSGVKPAITAIVLHAAYRIGGHALRNPVLWVLAALAFLALFALHIPFPAIVASAALAGYAGGKFAPRYFQNGNPAPKPGAMAEPQPGTAAVLFLIDDTTPAPPHARFSWLGLLRVTVTFALLWSLPMVFLISALGWGHTLTQMAWFFTKAALLTFGGAYAVLPYVYQGAVTHYGWLSPRQMMDGLALGETTPGPLIMVVAYVAFIGGYFSSDTQALMNGHSGGGPTFFAGALAACLVAWFTFLPSFYFILAGGPLVESTHGEWRFTAPLAAISAAVVGVIFNLALFFGYHLLWPSGFAGKMDWVSALLALAAALALFAFRQKVMAVIFAGAVIGLVRALILGPG